MFREYDFSFKKTSERIFILGVLTVLILMGTHTHAFSLAAFVICSLIVVFDKTNFKLMLMTYLMLMAHIFKISPDNMSYFTFLMFLYIGVKLIEEKRILWSAVFFIFFMVGVQMIRLNFSFTDDLKLAGNILFIGYALGDIKSFSVKDRDMLCVTYVSSVIISSFLRFLDSDFFRISDYTAALNTEGFGAGSEEIVRFSGLYKDPNYYSVNLIIALCLLVLLYYENHVSMSFCAVSAVLILYFGTLTYSKSFLLILILPLLLFLYANNRVGRYDVQIISMASILLAIALLLVINPDFITNMQKRIESGSSLTTGRSEVWMGYLDYIYSHPDVMLFGAGIGADLLYGTAMHNVYVEILYHLGICGGFLLIVAIINSGIIYRKAFQKNFFNWSVMIGVLVTYAWLSQLHDYEFPIHFMLAYMVLFLWNFNTVSESEASGISIPLVPDIRDNKIKTLFPSEDRE